MLRKRVLAGATLGLALGFLPAAAVYAHHFDDAHEDLHEGLEEQHENFHAGEADEHRAFHEQLNDEREDGVPGRVVRAQHRRFHQEEALEHAREHEALEDEHEDFHEDEGDFPWSWW